ncbi:hypothetical protein M9H77_28350 [Catharanthus roseus]|uniref:Uncharacterized protein n=1 Tax=Catharanthus roseus TaxID=4058 RepID=A0ACC0AGI8_CATRO|nr:hypothetical protein M9H77_28350 [Catharanthus roseus]
MLRGYSSGYDHMFGSVRELHCTWLVPRTRDPSDGVDGFRLERVDPLEDGCSTVEGLAQSVYRYSKTLKLGMEFLVRVSPKGHVFLFYFLMLEPFVKIENHFIRKRNTRNSR